MNTLSYERRVSNWIFNHQIFDAASESVCKCLKFQIIKHHPFPEFFYAKSPASSPAETDNNYSENILQIHYHYQDLKLDKKKHTKNKNLASIIIKNLTH